MKVTVAAEYLKLPLPVVPNHRVDDMVHPLGLLRIRDAPVSDQLKLREALLNSELALVLLKLFLLLQHAVILLLNRVEGSTCRLNVSLRLLLRLAWLFDGACRHRLSQSSLELHRPSVDAVSHAESDAVRADVTRAKDRVRCVLFIVEEVQTRVVVLCDG